VNTIEFYLIVYSEALRTLSLSTYDTLVEPGLLDKACLS